MGESAHEPVAETHEGVYDAATGLWDYPDPDPEESLTWARILDQWAILEPAFHMRYGVDLEDALHVKSWRWFTVRVLYLIFADDNALARVLAPSRFQPPEPPEPAPLEL